MKHNKKPHLFYIIFFLFICTNIHAQKFDIDEFHIPDGLDLTDSQYERLQNTGEQLRAKLVEDLQAQGYDIISPRKSRIKLERVGIDDIRIDYDPEAERVIFGKLLAVSNYITVSTYLYGSQNGIRTSHEPLTTTILNHKNSELNDQKEIDAAVSEIITGLFPDRPKPPIAEPPPPPKVDPPIVKKPEPNPEPITPPKSKKEKKEKPPKPPKLTEGKVCSKTPGAVLVVAGGLMGGTGFYLRSKAVKIYDEDYIQVVGKPGARAELDRARKPNRMAHILGAGGILTAGLGAYLWTKCAKKNKQSIGKHDLQITPQFEYNASTNTNTVAAKISFSF